mmetsp:Transcript_80912/g.182559  ORF Transcript_80912/g.182559 Transcript_80912/m.182559 type:complete len:328 (+) Transcript_80912:49-1032(+)
MAGAMAGVAGSAGRGLHDLTTRSCNASVPRRRRSFCGRPTYGLSELMFFLANYETVPGFIGISTAYFIHFVSLLQCDLGVTGAIGEIGVAGGKSFAAMAFTRQEGENLLACDLFSTGIEKDNVPDANLPLFLNTLDALRIPEEDVVILKQSSLQLSDDNLVNLGVGRRRTRGKVGAFRLFHVDGGHYAEAAFHDINSAACSLVPGGVLLVDDLHNMGWPGVQEGFHRYMASERPKRQLVPFLYTGRLFLTTPGYAEAYRRGILRAYPRFETQTLYDTEVISAPAHKVNVEAYDFQALYEGRLPRAANRAQASAAGSSVEPIQTSRQA